MLANLFYELKIINQNKIKNMCIYVYLYIGDQRRTINFKVFLQNFIFFFSLFYFFLFGKKREEIYVGIYQNEKKRTKRIGICRFVS